MYVKPEFLLVILLLNAKITFPLEDYIYNFDYVDEVEEEEEYEIVRHDEVFAKTYFEDVKRTANDVTSFITSTINVFHFDLLMNAFRLISTAREQYFIHQINFEASNFTDPAKKGKDRLIAQNLAFISYQAKKYAADNYLQIIQTVKIPYKMFDYNNPLSYSKEANLFHSQYTQSPQLAETDNCSIGLVSVVGVEAKWKYPFKMEGHYMRAIGKFNFAHDLNFKIDILEIPFERDDMLLTIVISRNHLYYLETQRLFHLAYKGKFNVQIGNVYLPKLAFSVIIKDYSIDVKSNAENSTKYRCMTQKIVLNVNEEGVDVRIKDKPYAKDWDTTDWKYNIYYPMTNICVVDSPFFFSITYVPTREFVMMGKWRPSDGLYIENSIYMRSDEITPN